MSEDRERVPEARDIVWTPIWDPARVGWGVELLRLSGERSAMSDAIAFDEEGRPFHFAYRIDWDSGWRVKRVEVEIVQAGNARSLTLVAEGAGSWRDAAGAGIDEIGGCIDVDIWPTPFTNTFPIRRLADRLAERTVCTVAYVRAPALELTTQRQAYTRLDDRHVLFELVDSDFRAELEVDGDGIVLDYEGLFRRLV